ncbi:Ubiquitin carboxyl-terminal hydrolase 34 [Pelomyxa schiedti]|nr:Ubiquitin carboxyl-terminal hydrolase 34 [Pelomyxa schiedti]
MSKPTSTPPAPTPTPPEGNGKPGTITLAQAVAQQTAPPPEEPHERPPMNYANIKRKDLHPDYIDMINYFGKLNGFEKILERLQATTPPPNVEITRYLLRAVKYCSECFLPQFADPFVPKLAKVAFAQLPVLGKQEMNIPTRQAFKECMKNTTETMKILFDPERVSIAKDACTLDIAFTNFDSSGLEARFRGLKLLRKMIQRTEPTENRLKTYAMYYMSGQWAGPNAKPPPPPPPRQIAPKYLVTKFEEHHILDKVCDFTHPELIRNGADVLVFYTKYTTLLATSHISRIWSQAVGKHESIKHAVFSTLLQLVPTLSAPLVTDLCNKIKQIPLEEHDIESIAFLKKFTQEVVGTKSVSDLPDGVEVLWKLAMKTEARIQTSIADKAFEYLLELLKDSDSLPEQMRLKYLYFAAENVGQRQKVWISFQVLQEVIGTFPVKRRSKIIETLNRNYNLLDKVIQDIVVYKKAAVDKAATLGGDPRSPKPSLNSAILDGEFPHLEQLKFRLEFLQFIVHNGFLSLSEPQVDALWEALVSTTLTWEERELFYSWLANTSVPAEALQPKTGSFWTTWGEDPSITAFSDPVVLHLFDKMAKSLDCSGISKTLFALFRRFFLYINFKAELIRTEQEEESQKAVEPEFYAIAQSLNGEDTLRAIAMGAMDEDVALMAIHLLNNLHLYILNDAKPRQRAQFREFYIKSTLDHITCTISELESDTAKPVDEAVLTRHKHANTELQRCLLLLKSYIQEWEDLTARNTAIAKVSSPLGSPMKLFFQLDDPKAKEKADTSKWGKFFSKSNKDLVQLEYIHPPEEPKRKAMTPVFKKAPGNLMVTGIFSTDTIAALRTKVANSIPQPLQISLYEGIQGVTLPKPKVTLFLNGKELKEDNRTVDTIREQSLIYVKYEAVQETETMEAINSHIGNLANTFVGLPPRSSELHEETVNRGTTATNSGTKDPGHPINILSQPKNFEILQKLLQMNLEGPAGDKIGYQCWELLDMLLSTDTATPPFLNWSEALNPAKPYLLLYSLQVINSCIKSQLATVKWQESFITKGGLTQLVKILMEMDRSFPSVGCRKSFHLTLSNLHFLLTEKSSPPSSSSVTTSPPKEPISILRESATSIVTAEFICKILQLLRALALTRASIRDPRSALCDDDGDGDAAMMGMQLISLAIQKDASMCTILFRWLTQEEDDWLQSVLLVAPQNKLRSEVAEYIFRICVNFKILPKGDMEHPVAFFLKIMLLMLNSVDVYKTTCKKFFCLMCDLLLVQVDGVDVTNIDNPVAVAQTVAQKMIEHPPCEESSSSLTDQVFTGLLSLLLTLYQKYKFKTGFVRELFRNCLFKVPNFKKFGQLGLPKCKTDESRRAAYRLLLEFSRINPDNFFELVHFIDEQLAKLDMGIDWSYHPMDNERSQWGFVGLRNQGATCYMNSLLQQLFHIPCFRRGILSIEGVAELTKENDNTSGAWDVLTQLQILFSNLQESLKRAYDTAPFCTTIKDFEGNPVNTNQQMDANEFFNMVFDKMETTLKKIPSQKDLLKQVFSGTLSQQLIPKECSHASRREENFYSLSVEIKNKKNIQEALNLFIEGELLAGDNAWKCETCNKRVDTLKRACVETLPHMLLLHLKRFEFKMELMRNIKINDSCEFPMQLNMEPYTRDGVERRESGSTAPPQHPSWYYQYELVGIVVHQGTADSGHYYSLHRETTPPYTRWFEFNDTLVMPFDPKQIPNECFGGYEDVNVWDASEQRYVQQTRAKINNAYILFYQRVHPSTNREHTVEPILPPPPPSPAPKPPPESSSAQPETSDNQVETGTTASPPPTLTAATTSTTTSSTTETVDMNLYDMSKAGIPKFLAKRIWVDNCALILKKQIFHPDYLNFIWDLMKIYTNHPEHKAYIETLKFSLKFCFLVYARAKDKPLFLAWIHRIKSLLSCEQANMWFLPFLVENRDFLKKLFIYCPLERARQSSVELVMHSITQLVTSPGGIPKEEANSIVINFLNTIFSLFKSARSKSRFAQEMFAIVLQFAKLGTEQKHYLIFQRSFVSAAISYFLGKEYTSLLPPPPAPTAPSATTSTETPQPTTTSSTTETTLGAPPAPPPPKAPGAIPPAPPYLPYSSPFASSRYLVHLIETLPMLLSSVALPDLPAEGESSDSGTPTVTPTVTPVKGTTEETAGVEATPAACLPMKDLLALLDKNFWGKLIRDNASPSSVSSLINTLCLGNKDRSQKLCEVFAEGMARMGMDLILFKPYYKAMKVFLSLSDPLKDWRCKAVMKAIKVELNKQDPVLCKDTIKFLGGLIARLATKDSGFRLVFLQQKEKLNKVLAPANWHFVC